MRVDLGSFGAFSQAPRSPPMTSWVGSPLGKVTAQYRACTEPCRPGTPLLTEVWKSSHV